MNLLNLGPEPDTKIKAQERQDTPLLVRRSGHLQGTWQPVGISGQRRKGEGTLALQAQEVNSAKIQCSWKQALLPVPADANPAWRA